MLEFTKKIEVIMKYILSIFLLFIIGCNNNSDGITNNDLDIENTIISKYGQLSVIDNLIVDKNKDPIVLRGMSLFWSQWGGAFYNKETIKWLRDDWNCTIIRAAMGIESGGYLENSEVEYQKIKIVIEACIELGIYVIIDWHDHHAENHLEEAKTFFNNISSSYGSYPNIIYEIYNEPLNVSWQEVLKPFSQNIIDVIRKNDPDNLIIVGTSNWAQDVDDVINNEINDSNVVYSLHFYTSTHEQWLRNKAKLALEANIPIFISEFGVSEANGNGIIDIAETNIWVDFLEQNNLSWCNWSIINKDETSAALLPTTTKVSGWLDEELTESGKMIRDYLIRMNSTVFDSLVN
jgi:endoglucanase